MEITDVKYVRVILTNRCNMFCTFCHKEGCSFSEQDVDFELLMKTISQLYEIGYRKIKLMGGEPMLYSKIAEVIKFTKKIDNNIDISMISNGSFPTDKYLELFDAGLDRLNISVHGWNTKYFFSNTKGSNALCRKVKANIFELIQRNKINKINYVLKKNNNETDFIEMIEALSGTEIIIDVLNLLNVDEDKEINNLQYNFDEIEKFVGEHWKIVGSSIYNNPFSLPSKRLVLDNGCIINLKINKLGQQRIFNSCNNCTRKSDCIEGIKAIRITNEGLLQPCILRMDNVLDLKEACSKEVIVKYLKNL